MITAKVISAIEVPRLNKFVNEELKAFLIMCEIESVGGFALRNTLLEFPVYADYWIMGKGEQTQSYILTFKFTNILRKRGATSKEPGPSFGKEYTHIHKSEWISY